MGFPDPVRKGIAALVTAMAIAYLCVATAAIRYTAGLAVQFVHRPGIVHPDHLLELLAALGQLGDGQAGGIG
jgi:hypothetical protein